MSYTVERNVQSIVPSPASRTTPMSKYSEEWCRLFEPAIQLDGLRQVCFNGQLNGSRFRSVCWRILLGCLPLEKKNWMETLRNSRRLYADLQRMVMLNPRDKAAKADPTLTNPLSLNDDNPWQQFFSDNELRASIRQDVRRTFPELEYFQSEHTRELMQNVLFVYARHNPQISYKQGMHEILGPLLFVLFYDYQAFAHSRECDGLSGIPAESLDVVNELTNDQYLEHDSYTLFTQIMHIIEPWYYVPDEEQAAAEDTSGPFVRPQDTNRSSAVVAKLNSIGDELLSKCDAELYKQLERLQIAPQIYGIRWLRLLFGREFPIQDLLLVWDSIFADGPPFVLVDYIFIAMLVSIRQLLLTSDYTGCLNYLMRFPPVVDVHAFLQLARQLKNPVNVGPTKLNKSRNSLVSSQPLHFSHITQSGTPHPNRTRDDLPPPQPPPGLVKAAAAANKNLQILGTNISLNRSAPGTPAKMLNSLANNLRDNLKEAGQAAIQAANQGDVRAVRSTSSTPLNQRRPTFIGHVGGAGGWPTSKPDTPSAAEMETLHERVECLQSRVCYLENIIKQTAGRLDACADSCGGARIDVKCAVQTLRGAVGQPSALPNGGVGRAPSPARDALYMVSDPLSPDVSSVISTLPRDNELKTLNHHTQ